MRRNNDLIDQSDLLAILVETIETCYSEDVSLLVCYGSYVTGDYGSHSDIDFFFVPRTDRGYALGHQFILDDIGYDLWPVSWQRLNNISKLEDQPASILMDGVVLFASSEDDLRKLDELKDNFKQNLNNEALAGRMSTKYLAKAKATYFDLQNCENELFFVGAMNVTETLLVAVAILNGTYLKKGLKRIESELDRLSMAPGRFLENYRKLIRTSDRAEAGQLVHALIVESEKLWKSKFEPDTKKADPSDLAGFYEEFKSTYNKLLLACDEKNYENAYYAGFMVDRETQLFLVSYTGPGIFPNIIDLVLKFDFDSLRAGCLEHERQLIQLLHGNGIEIHAYRDSDELRQYFLGKAT